MIIGIAFVFVLAISLFSQSHLILVGLCMVIAGRIWFAAQILAELDLANAITVFVVPFMPTLFFFKRFDVAWKPFLFGIVGIILFLIGLTTTSQ